MYTGAVGTMRRKAVEFVTSIPQLLMRLKEFLVAMVILLIIVLVIILIVVLVRYFHPRLCSINRSAAFEAYMEGHLVNLENHVFLLRKLMVDDVQEDSGVGLLFNAGTSDMGVLSGNAGPCSTVPSPSPTSQGSSDGLGKSAATTCVIDPQKRERLADLIKKLSDPGRKAFHENIDIYYRYYNTIQRLDRFVYSFFAKRDILNEHRFVEKNDRGESKEIMDEDAVKKYKETFLEPFDKLREALREVSSEFAGWSGLYHQPWYDNSMFDFLTAVHMMHLMTNEYHDQITFSYDTRKALTLGMQFNVWTLYYVPYAEKTFTVRIPNIWTGFGDIFASNRDFILDGWSKLRSMLVSLPKNLASSELFTNDYPTSSDDKNENDEDVVETFGFLKGLLSIGEFFANIIEVAIALFKLVTDPVNTVFRMIVIVLGTIMGLVLLLGHTLLTLLGIHWLIAIVFGFFMALTICILLTVVEIIFVAILTVVFAVLWFLDLLTGGMIVKLMRCENSPNEWEHRANYAENNKTVRYFGTACCYPCPSRFTPSLGGALCYRLPRYIPSYCPHQQIITAFREKDVKGGGADNPYMFDRYPVSADPSVLYKNRPEKEKILLEAFERARLFLGSCYRAFKKYDYVNRHVCFNIDRLPDSAYPEHVKQKLRALCAQTYCEFQPRERSHRQHTVDMRSEEAVKNDCLCRMLAPKPDEPSSPPPESPPRRPNTSNLFRRTLLMFIIVMLLLVAIYSLADTAAVLFESRSGNINAVVQS